MKRRRRYVALGRELKRYRQGFKFRQDWLVDGIYSQSASAPLWRSLERGEFRPDRDKLIRILVEKFDLTDIAEINRLMRLAAYEGLTPNEASRVLGNLVRAAS